MPYKYHINKLNNLNRSVSSTIQNKISLLWEHGLQNVLIKNVKSCKV